MALEGRLKRVNIGTAENAAGFVVMCTCRTNNSSLVYKVDNCSAGQEHPAVMNLSNSLKPLAGLKSCVWIQLSSVNFYTFCIS